MYFKHYLRAGKNKIGALLSVFMFLLCSLFRFCFFYAFKYCFIRNVYK